MTNKNLDALLSALLVLSSSFLVFSVPAHAQQQTFTTEVFMIPTAELNFTNNQVPLQGVMVGVTGIDSNWIGQPSEPSHLRFGDDFLRLETLSTGDIDILKSNLNLGPSWLPFNNRGYYLKNSSGMLTYILLVEAWFNGSKARVVLGPTLNPTTLNIPVLEATVGFP